MEAKSDSSESLHSRSYFYVGGRYVEDEKGQHVMTDQMYVEKLLPLSGVQHPWPIVFIHGGGQTGTVSLNSALCHSYSTLQDHCETMLEKG